MDFCTNDDMLDLAVYESASLFDLLTGDCFLYDDAEAIYEATYSHFYSDNGDKSYVATIGKKTHSGAVSNDSSFLKKAAFHMKRIRIRMLVSTINFFKAIGEGLRRLIQGFLIPLNALIQSVTGRPNETLAVLTKQEKIIWEKAKREAESRVANVGRNGVQKIYKCIDIAFNLASKSTVWAKDAFSKGMNYQLAGMEKDKFSNFQDLHDKLKESFSDLRDRLDAELSDVDKAKEEIYGEVKGISSKYYRRALIASMTMQKDEIKYAINKATELNKKSSEMLRVCKELQEKSSSDKFEMSTDVNKIAKQHNAIASLCNTITAYLGTYLGRFGIKAKIENTGA